MGGIGPGLYKLEDWNKELDIEKKNFLNTDFPYTEKWNLNFTESIDDEDFTETEGFQNWELEYFNPDSALGIYCT